MKIRAKVQCDSVTQSPGGGETVRFFAVVGGNPEDNTYARATPSALVEMFIDNPDAQGAFVAGEKYYLEFTPEEAASGASGLDIGLAGTQAAPIAEAAPAPAPTQPESPKRTVVTGLE